MVGGEKEESARGVAGTSGDGGLGSDGATKTARTFVAAVMVFTPHAQKSDLEQLENALEEELQRGTTSGGIP
jgi:hypothetical protein